MSTYTIVVSRYLLLALAFGAQVGALLVMDGAR